MGIIATIVFVSYFLTLIGASASETVAMIVSGLGLPMLVISIIWAMNSPTDITTAPPTQFVKYYRLSIVVLSAMSLLTSIWYFKSTINDGL